MELAKLETSQKAQEVQQLKRSIEDLQSKSAEMAEVRQALADQKEANKQLRNGVMLAKQESTRHL